MPFATLLALTELHDAPTNADDDERLPALHADETESERTERLKRFAAGRKSYATRTARRNANAPNN